MKGFLDNLDTKGIKVNFDPANLVMVVGDDPVRGVEILKDYIIHTHAKDGIMLQKTDAERIYGGEKGFRGDQYYRETPLGEGSVDFDNYLKALYSIGYKGFLTIEREVGEHPEEDIRKAVEFLKLKITKI